MKPDKQLRDRCPDCGFFHSKKSGKQKKCKSIGYVQVGCACCGKMVGFNKVKCKAHSEYERCIIIGCGEIVKKSPWCLPICPDGMKHHRLITGSSHQKMDIMSKHSRCYFEMKSNQQFIYSGPRGLPSIRGKKGDGYLCLQPSYGHHQKCKMHILMEKKLCLCGRVPPDRMFIGMLLHRRIIYRDVFNMMIKLLSTPMACYHSK